MQAIEDRTVNMARIETTYQTRHCVSVGDIVEYEFQSGWMDVEVLALHDGYAVVVSEEDVSAEELQGRKIEAGQPFEAGYLLLRIPAKYLHECPADAVFKLVSAGDQTGQNIATIRPGQRVAPDHENQRGQLTGTIIEVRNDGVLIELDDDAAAEIGEPIVFNKWDHMPEFIDGPAIETRKPVAATDEDRIAIIRPGQRCRASAGDAADVPGKVLKVMPEGVLIKLDDPEASDEGNGVVFNAWDADAPAFPDAEAVPASRLSGVSTNHDAPTALSICGRDLIRVGGKVGFMCETSDAEQTGEVLSIDADGLVVRAKTGPHTGKRVAVDWPSVYLTHVANNESDGAK